MLNRPLLNGTFDLLSNVVFNPGMSLNAHPDWSLIVDLGGPLKVAELLGFPKAGGVQRVQNWKARGIPAHVKVRYPEIFMAPGDAQGHSGGSGLARQ